MKKLIIRGSVFLVILFAVDKPIGREISNLAVKRQYDDRIGRLGKGDINAEVIMLGSSRALNNLNAGLFEDISKKKAFNLAFSGSNHTFHLSILRIALQTFTPEAIMLTIDQGAAFIPNKKSIYRKDLLYPFTCHSIVYKELCDHVEKNYLLGQCFWMYRENNNLISAFTYLKEGKLAPDLTSDIDQYGSVMINGQSPDFKTIAPHEGELTYSETLESPELLNSFNAILDICRERQIKLFLVLPPHLHKSYGAFKRRLAVVTDDRAQIVDMTDLELPESCYFDAGHLNQKGAGVFTRELYNRVADGL